ncbi:MAG: DUF2141 domain-containing protein [Bacteroidota bacterium]
MRTVFTVVAVIIAVVFQSFTRPVANGTVTVEVVNLKNSKGVVLVSLFNDSKSFPKEATKAVGKGKVEIQNGKATISFSNLPFGTYAAAILHDENSNLKMDFNMVGMPKEGYGFSNDAKGKLGPPAFDKAAVQLQQEQMKIVINAQYFMR